MAGNRDYEASTVRVLHNVPVPTLRWRHYQLTAEQARLWANELLTAANLAEQSWGLEEAARDSKVGK